MNVQLYSYSQTNTYSTWTVFNLEMLRLESNLMQGKHLTQGGSVSFSSSIYSGIFYGVNKETGLIDYDIMIALSEKEKSKLIICKASAYS